MINANPGRQDLHTPDYLTQFYAEQLGLQALHALIPPKEKKPAWHSVHVFVALLKAYPGWHIVHLPVVLWQTEQPSVAHTVHTLFPAKAKYLYEHGIHVLF